jgi:hypothetical protein
VSRDPVAACITAPAQLSSEHGSFCRYCGRMLLHHATQLLVLHAANRAAWRSASVTTGCGEFSKIVCSSPFFVLSKRKPLPMNSLTQK